MSPYHSVSSVPTLVDANRRLQSLLWSQVSLEGGSWDRHPVTFRPETVHIRIGWIKQEGFWFGAEEREDHYWMPFGLIEPDGVKSLNITVEINTPLCREHGRAGLILTRNGALYLAHTGTVGGGKKGVTRESFLSFLGASAPDLVEYDGSKQAIVISDFDDPACVANIGGFVKQVRDFKDSV